jgi:hypothetical protein
MRRCTVLRFTISNPKPVEGLGRTWYACKQALSSPMDTLRSIDLLCCMVSLSLPCLPLDLGQTAFDISHEAGGAQDPILVPGLYDSLASGSQLSSLSLLCCLRGSNASEAGDQGCEGGALRRIGYGTVRHRGQRRGSCGV